MLLYALFSQLSFLSFMHSNDEFLSSLATSETQQQGTSAPVADPNLASNCQSNLHVNTSPIYINTNNQAIINSNISKKDTHCSSIFVTINLFQSYDSPPISSDINTCIDCILLIDRVPDLP